MDRAQLEARIAAIVEQQAASVTALQRELAALADAVFPRQEGRRLVRAGESLQAALDAGGAIRLEDGATFAAARFTVRRPLDVVGNGIRIIGEAGPALHVVPGTTDVRFTGAIDCLSRRDQGVVVLGDNSSATQGTLDAVPARIVLTGLRVPTHRGKAAFEVHARQVALLDCHAADTWAPSLSDSKGVWIHNTPGEVLIRGGSYSSGSECILTGGETVRIPGNVPEGITVEEARLWRPLEWQTDGVRRAVKNLLELKTGRRVRVRRCVLDGAWRDAQSGYAIMLTASQGEVQDVAVEGCRIQNVGGGVNVTGSDKYAQFPGRTRGIVVSDSLFLINRTRFGGNGWTALVQGGPESVRLERIVSVHDGAALVEVSTGPVPVDELAVVDSLAVPGQYGIRLGGTSNAAPNPAAVARLTVERTTFAEPASSTLKRNLDPSNRYVPRETFDQEVAATLERFPAA
jgi:hypothetical protein